MHWGRQCTAHIELPNAGPGNAPKGVSPSFIKGVNAFLSIVSRWKGVKICEGWLKLRSFQCIGGGTLHAFFFLVSGLHCVRKRAAWI